MQKNLVWAAVALALSPIAGAQEIDPRDARFTVGDIRVEGLQRVSEGTVYNYLPVNIGDDLGTQRLREAMRALYATGFFRNVELRRDGDTLVVVVKERPSIESFELKGNKDFKTEELTKSLRNLGLAAGKTFDRAVLEELRGYLTEQYFSRGKYGVTIDTQVEEQPDNRVRIKIDIKEGARARIRQINIVGNTKFKEKDILESFELKTPKWNNWWKQNTRYSRESLSGDLEKLKSWYQDRGYANMDIESAQVTISPEKDDMFITVSVKEGEIYKIADASIAGQTIVPLKDLQQLVLVQKGQIYNQQMISATQKLIENRLGIEGYAFAKVDPVPKLDDEKKEVTMTFLVDPGKRVYVRHVTFAGVTRTNDVVLRRELRQLEGAWVSNILLERSKQRIQQLPYIEKVEFEKNRVEGSDDLVDVEYTIKEGPSAQLSGGIGYSASSSFMLNGSYADSNFMGTGKRVAFELNTGKYAKVLSFSNTNQYLTINNISRTYSMRYSDVTQFVSASSDFSSKSISGGLEFGYPISEIQGLRFGMNVTRSELLTTSSGSALQAQNWVQQNGKPYSRSAVDDYGNIFEFFGSRYTGFELSAAWYLQSLNRGLFPDRGQRQSLSLSSSIPGTSIEYWVADYQFVQYVPIWRRLTGMVNLRASYGDSFGSTTALPPYRLFFGGGPDTVRGYRESRLGPKDNYGNPYGGNFLVVARSELIIPMPEKFQSSARVSLFYDMGNVFSTNNNVQFYGRDTLTPVTYKFKYSSLRRSAGLSVEWLAPLGLFRFSYGVPLNPQKGNSVIFPDEKERFQFSVGQAF
ncbi:MAG: outer membrane protein assembly factor BamA [Gammaproteobacteria bacterium]|jgi:outer membrane protein insertion porin family|nr:outer membrane protein assembly factor BamA [Gammaproteobacteria bacterium]